ncbi:MAG: hypothetical protein IJ074_08510 [Clostridia bacterium]|nr:hypothetical protein [Clostridia bacterium]
MFNSSLYFMPFGIDCIITNGRAFCNRIDYGKKEMVIGFSAETFFDIQMGKARIVEKRAARLTGRRLRRTMVLYLKTPTLGEP